MGKEELVIERNNFSCNVSHAGDTMNLSSQRSTRENIIGGEPAGSTVVVKSKTETKARPAVVSYNYEAAISQPDIPTYSKVDDNTRESCPESCNKSPTANEKASFVPTCGKVSVTIKRRGIGVRSRVRLKKVTRTRGQIYDVCKIQEEPTFCTNVYRDDGATNQNTSPNIHQEDPTKTRDVPTQPEIAINKDGFGKRITCREAINLREDGNTCENVANTRLYVSPKKTSKIPRIKPNFFLSTDEESRVCLSAATLPVRKKSKCTAEVKPLECNEERKFVHRVHVCNELGNITKQETVDVNDCRQGSKDANITRIVRENSTNFFLESLGKSSEADIDFEELEEDLPTTTNESPIIISADDAPRSAAFASMKSLSLKCRECHLRNDRKYTPVARKDRYSETDYGSSSEMESAGRLFEKSAGDSEFTDMSSEDTDLLSDYLVNYKRDKISGSKRTFGHTCRAMKPSPLNNSARMRTTSLTFFNVFFDIVFWPIIFLRAKQ